MGAESCDAETVVAGERTRPRVLAMTPSSLRTFPDVRTRLSADDAR